MPLPHKTLCLQLPTTGCVFGPQFRLPVPVRRDAKHQQPGNNSFLVPSSTSLAHKREDEEGLSILLKQQSQELKFEPGKVT